MPSLPVDTVHRLTSPLASTILAAGVVGTVVVLRVPTKVTSAVTVD